MEPSHDYSRESGGIHASSSFHMIITGGPTFYTKQHFPSAPTYLPHKKHKKTIQVGGILSNHSRKYSIIHSSKLRGIQGPVVQS